MKVRLAFCGAGMMGQAAHLRNYAQLGDECEIVAVSDVNPGRAAAVADRYGIPNAYESDEVLLSRHEVDGIVAIRPCSLHNQALGAVVAAGKPFLVEKPLSWSLVGGRLFYDAIRAAGSNCMVAYHKRSDPAVIYAKVEIDRIKASGELGKLRLVKAIMPPGDWVAGGFGELIRSGGDFPQLTGDIRDSYDDETQEKFFLFVNYYIHQVNLLRHLLGENYEFEYVDPRETVAVGRSVSGVPCLLEMAPYHTTRAWNEQAWACFERGFVKIELPPPLAHNRSGRVTVFQDRGDGFTPVTMSPDLPPRDAMMQQACNFLALVRGEAAPPVGAAEALLDLKVARKYIQLLTEKR